MYTVRSWGLLCTIYRRYFILFFKSANNFSFLLSIVFCVIRLRELECFFFFGVRAFGFEITLCMHTVVEMIPSRGITIRSTTWCSWLHWVNMWDHVPSCTRTEHNPSIQGITQLAPAHCATPTHSSNHTPLHTWTHTSHCQITVSSRVLFRQKEWTRTQHLEQQYVDEQNNDDGWSSKLPRKHCTTLLLRMATGTTDPGNIC